MLTTPGQSGPGNDGNEGVLRIPQSSSIAGTSPSDCLVSYAGHSLVGGGSYPSAEVQSVYSTAPADWAKDLGFFMLYTYSFVYTLLDTHFGGNRGVMVIVVGNRDGDTSSNPGRGSLRFT